MHNLEQQHFRIRSLSFLDLSEEATYAYTSYGSFPFSDKHLIDILRIIALRSGQTLSKSELEELLVHPTLDSASLFNLLKKHLRLFEPARANNGSTGELLFVTDDLEVTSILTAALRRHVQLNVANYYDSSSPIDIRTNAVGVFLRYNGETIRRLTETAFLSSRPLLLAYALDDIWMIDSVYIPEEFTPCHFCRIHYRRADQNNPRLVPGRSKFHNKRIKFDENAVITEVPAHLGDLQTAFVFMHIFRKCRTLFDPFAPPARADEFFSAKIVSPDQGTCENDWYAHHPLCGCTVGEF